MPDPCRLEFIGGKGLAEMGEQQGSALRPWHTDRPAEELRCDLMAGFCGGEQNRLLIERLGVEKQTIHVEDDSSWRPGQHHVV